MYRAAHMRKSCLSCCYRRRKWAVAFICWAACKPCEVKNKKDCSPETEPGFQNSGPNNIKLNSVRERISLYLFTMCVFSVSAFVCNQKSVFQPLWDVGPCSLKGWSMPALLWTFLCNKITQKRHFQEVQRQIKKKKKKTLFSFFTLYVYFWSVAVCPRLQEDILVPINEKS